VQEKTVVDAAAAHCYYAMEQVMVVVDVALSKRFLSRPIE